MNNEINSNDELILLEKSLTELEFQSLLEYISKKCYSEPGKNLILNSRPIANQIQLQLELDLIDEMMQIITGEDKLPFENFNDIKPLLHKSKIQNAILTTTEILKISEALRIFRLIKSYFEDKSEKYPNLYNMTSEILANRLLEKHIIDCIEETGEVKDSASRDLLSIRKKILSKSNYLRHRISNILQRFADLDMTQEDFVSIREGRFVIPLKSEHKRHIPGIIHGISQTGATVFIEPSEIIELNNELSLLHNEEKREIYRILTNLTSEISEHSSEYLQSFEILVHLDAIIAKTNYALEFNGLKPIIDNDGISLKSIRHPLLVHTKGLKKVVPLDLDFSAQQRGHLISGPNAGGKTVALKSIGLNIALALSGIYPLGEVKTNFMMIYTSIGDDQSIEQDLSTFSSQMTKIKKILQHADKDSIVLIDEIGSGTDPHEGSALSAGILETLIEYKSYFVATTHNTFLKSFALTKKEILNDSLEFDTKKLTPTYHFLSGIPGNSYAFYLAKNIGLPDNVLKRANKYLGEQHHIIEESVKQINKLKSQIAQKLNEINEVKLKSEKNRTKYEEKIKKFNLQREKLIERAKEEADEIILKANSLIENTIKEIKEKEKPVKEIKKKFSQEVKKITQSKRKKNKSKENIKIDEFKIGDFVISDESDTVGKIINIYENNTALIDFNGIKFKLPLNSLTLSSKQENPKDGTDGFVSFDVKSSIDVRGMRAYEAIPEIEKFIDDAILSNINTLTIIHGKGTGALRKALREYLDNHHSIKSYRTGNLLEGGDGVTIVELE